VRGSEAVDDRARWHGSRLSHASLVEVREAASKGRRPACMDEVGLEVPINE
jgi:hypothetical protein